MILKKKILTLMIGVVLSSSASANIVFDGSWVAKIVDGVIEHGKQQAVNVENALKDMKTEAFSVGQSVSQDLGIASQTIIREDASRMKMANIKDQLEMRKANVCDDLQTSDVLKDSICDAFIEANKLVDEENSRLSDIGNTQGKAEFIPKTEDEELEFVKDPVNSFKYAMPLKSDLRTDNLQMIYAKKNAFEKTALAFGQSANLKTKNVVNVLANSNLESFEVDKQNELFDMTKTQSYRKIAIQYAEKNYLALEKYRSDLEYEVVLSAILSKRI